MTKRPEWDLDRAYGEEGEDTVRRILELAAAQIEIKRKRRCDDIFYVETHQSPYATGTYRPSGANTTTAEYWAYLIANSGIVVLLPTQLLKTAALAGEKTQERDGDNPTRGRLVSFTTILNTARATLGRAA